jgi:hypothetical protein
MTTHQAIAMAFPLLVAGLLGAFAWMISKPKARQLPDPKATEALAALHASGVIEETYRRLGHADQIIQDTRKRLLEGAPKA